MRSADLVNQFEVELVDVDFGLVGVDVGLLAAPGDEALVVVGELVVEALFEAAFEPSLLEDRESVL